MAGLWHNCEGTHSLPSKEAVPRELVNAGYGICRICNKMVKLRKDGTCRAHVNTDLAKRMRAEDSERERNHAVSDLLKMREELSAAPTEPKESHG